MDGTPNKTQKIRLLEVKNTSPKIETVNTEDQKRLDDKTKLQEMIAEKLSLIEETGESDKPVITGRIQKQENLMRELNSVFTHKTLSNKEKIEEMNKLFIEQIHPLHNQLITEMVYVSAQESFESCYSEELLTKL